MEVRTAEDRWNSFLKWSFRGLMVSMIVLLISSFWCENPVWRFITRFFKSGTELQKEVKKELKKD